MKVNWANLARAVANRLEFERLTHRAFFIDEASVRRTAVEFLQGISSLDLVPEYGHEDLGDGFHLDVVGRTKGAASLSFALEAKWMKSGGGTREWHREIVKDALRLESLEDEMAPATDRALLVAGVHQTIEAQLIARGVRAGGTLMKVLPHLLQEEDTALTLPQPQSRIPVRETHADLRKLFTGLAAAVGGELPVSYQVSLAGHHLSGPTMNSVEAYVWLVRRSRKRRTFDPTAAW